MSGERVPVDIYPVGVLHDIQRIYRALTVPSLRGKRLGVVRFVLRTERRYLASSVRKREWRAVRNSFNGYLAEHQGCAHNCGRGWTRKAASRRAERLCDQHVRASLAAFDEAAS